MNLTGKFVKIRDRRYPYYVVSHRGDFIEIIHPKDYCFRTGKTTRGRTASHHIDEIQSVGTSLFYPRPMAQKK